MCFLLQSTGQPSHDGGICGAEAQSGCCGMAGGSVLSAVGGSGKGIQ